MHAHGKRSQASLELTAPEHLEVLNQGKPEFELKLATTASGLLLAKQTLLNMAGSEPSADRALISTYYDTADGILRQQGLTLRVRGCDQIYVQTVKAVDPVVPLPLSRGEWEDSVEGDRPELDAPVSGSHLPPALDAADLRPLFISSIRRTIVELTSDDGTLIEGALDEGEIRAPDTGRAEPICEVELEYKRGDPAAIYGIGLRLIEAAPVRIEIRSKSDRGYQLVDRAPDAPAAWHPSAVALAREMTVEGALQEIGGDCLGTILRNEPAVLAGAADGLHQMRVAIRRLRAFLTALKRMLPPADQIWVGQELRWLANALGPARDWDVVTGNILAPADSALLGEQGRDALSRACESQRIHAHRQCATAILSTRYTATLLKLLQWFAQRGWRNQPVSEESTKLMAPIGAVAPALIAHRYKKVSKAIGEFSALNAKERHQVRINIKKLRYLVDIFGQLFKKDLVDTVARRLKPLQDELGYANDVRVASELWAALPGSGSLTNLDRAAGIVLGWHSHSLAEREERLLKRLRKLQRIRPFW